MSILVGPDGRVATHQMGPQPAFRFALVVASACLAAIVYLTAWFS